MTSISPALFLSKEANLLKWNPSSPQIQYPVIQQYHYKYHSFSQKSRIHSNFRTRTVKCLCNSNKNDDFSCKDENPFEVLGTSIVKALKSLQKPALLMYDPNYVFALSGGRMGGSSRSSSSYMDMATSVGTPPSPPFFGERYEGGAGIILFAFVFWYYTKGLRKIEERESIMAKRKEEERKSIYETTAGEKANNSSNASASYVGSFTDTERTPVYKKTTVLKLQVGLLGLGRSLQTDMNRIAKTADTSTTEGLHHVLTETILALRRHSEYCISSYSYVDVKESREEGDNRFNGLSIEERAKFDEETLVKQSSTKLKTSTENISNEDIVVTILVAAEGEFKLPSINNNENLKEALQELAAIHCGRIKALQVLWTPQEEDTFCWKKNFLNLFLY